MAFTLMEIILAVAISAVSGAIASLIAPWAKWGVEKKKNILHWRKGFIYECKGTIGDSKFNPDTFRETSNYLNLKTHLSGALQKEIDEKRRTPGKVMNLKQSLEVMEKEQAIKRKLLSEIVILEKKWGLL